MVQMWLPASVCGFVCGVLTYMIMRSVDRDRYRRWDGWNSSGVVASCVLFIGGIGGGTGGFWLMYPRFVNVSMYAPLEGALSGAAGGVMSSLLVGTLYAVEAAQR